MSNFRVALVNPKDTNIPVEDYAVYENLGLALLCATLRSHGYHVKIIDGYAENLDHNEVADRTIFFDPDIVGFTCTYQSYPDVLKIGRKLKKHLPGIHFTIGGEHATYTAIDILSESGIFNSVVRGEGEETLLELVRAIENGTSLLSVKGIYFKHNSKIVANPDRPAIEDIDSLPFASRDTLQHCLNNGKPALIGMLASRGCQSRCSFCNANQYFRLGGGKVIRRRSPKNIVDEIDVLYNEYITNGVRAKLFFYDAVASYIKPYFNNSLFLK